MSKISEKLRMIPSISLWLLYKHWRICKNVCTHRQKMDKDKGRKKARERKSRRKEGEKQH